MQLRLFRFLIFWGGGGWGVDVEVSTVLTSYHGTPQGFYDYAVRIYDGILTIL